MCEEVSRSGETALGKTDVRVFKSGPAIIFTRREFPSCTLAPFVVDGPVFPPHLPERTHPKPPNLYWKTISTPPPTEPTMPSLIFRVLVRHSTPAAGRHH